jgi:hypothetical protein
LMPPSPSSLASTGSAQVARCRHVANRATSAILIAAGELPRGINRRDWVVLYLAAFIFYLVLTIAINFL